MKKVFWTILILAGIAAGWWLLLGSSQQGAAFSVRELSNKVVYTLLADGSVADLRQDCAAREGDFNTCGSMCEPGEICTLVCAYTCDLSQIDADDTQMDADALDNSDRVVNDENLECGVKSDGSTVQCPLNFTCFTHEGSEPSCSDDPCSVCGAGEECLQLESYPVQIRCAEKGLEGVEEGEELIDSEVISNESSTVQSDNIVVNSPQANAVVTSPITVSGEARVFEGTVIIHVTTLSGDVLIEEIATARAPDVGEWGPYSAKINYDFSSTKEGFVKVFSESARDGSVENLVEVPVKFN